MTEEIRSNPERPTPLPWTRLETVAIGVLLVASIVAHFWHLGAPDSFVYDEHIYVDEAYKYLRGEAFFEVHPPFAIILITACTWLFGCHPWSWRVPSAVIGSALIPITYLLARRMFHSRRAGILASVLLLCEGMFLSYSRLALINIVYITLGAASYLALFRFMESRDLRDRRRSLVVMGACLGLGLGSKLAIPAIAVILAIWFVLASLIPPSSLFTRRGNLEGPASIDFSYALGAIALVGSVSAFFFFLTFLPNYLIGWWTGISSVTNYYRRVYVANAVYPSPPSHQDSPWWSWPLLLRPYKYWQKMDDSGMYLAVWGGGNPAIWWSALVAFVIAGVRALQRYGIAWTFLTIGYLLYMAMWVPVHRALYIYCYMPAFYLGILALAGVLDSCWRETARVWEQIALLLPVLTVSLLGMGDLYGAIASALCLGGFVATRIFSTWSGKYVTTVVVVTSIAVFLFYLPMWLPLPLTEGGVQARIWLDQSELVSWK